MLAFIQIPRARTCLVVASTLLALACNSLDGDSPDGNAAFDGGTLDAGATDGGSGPPGGNTVRVEESFDTTAGTGFTACSAHADCRLMPAGCNGCCQQAAVEIGTRRLYEAALRDACEAAGPPPYECDCSFTDVVPRCVSGHCQALPRDDFADSCFSPTRPDDAAGGEVGCRCDREGQQICVGAALVCRRAVPSDALAWIAVEDGPCWPRPDDCADGSIVETAGECLERFDDCYQRDDGSFCGAGTERVEPDT